MGDQQVSAFLDKLDVSLVDDTSNDGRGTWRLSCPLRYQSDAADQIITVPAGFKTDFASVPRLPLVFWLCGDTSHEAAVVHDYLYRYKITSRKMADAVLREASAVTGIPAWRRWLMWLGVRIGGQGPWDNEPPVRC